jgi:hypothetical protein
MNTTNFPSFDLTAAEVTLSRAATVRTINTNRTPRTFVRSSMLSKLFIAWCLLALCVTIHAIGLTAAFRWMRRRSATIEERFWPAAWMLICTAGWTILMHLFQIAIWAFFYAWKYAMPDLSSALYFSPVTYTTTGYGDLVLPKQWRLVGGVEALTGILMCGLSTRLFFAVFAKVFGLNRGSTPAA